MTKILIIKKDQSCYNRKVRLIGYELFLFINKILKDFKDIQEIRID